MRKYQVEIELTDFSANETSRIAVYADANDASSAVNTAFAELYQKMKSTGLINPVVVDSHSYKINA